MKQARIIKKAGLDAIEIRARADTPFDRTIVLLHGYGANMQDLAPIAQYLDPEQNYSWYFPNGISGLPPGAPYESRAWFNLDVERLIGLAMQGRFQDIADQPRPGLDEAGEAALSFIKELAVPPKELVLGGFSQGSITAVHTWITADLPLHALLLWSSTLTNRLAWQKKLTTNKSKPKILVSHGQYDQVLPFVLSKALVDLLRAHDHTVDFIDFAGEHEIPPQVLSASKKIIAS